MLLLSLLFSRLAGPVVLDGKKDFLGIERSALMVHDPTIPSHALCDLLNIHKNIHCVSEYHRPFWS